MQYLFIPVAFSTSNGNFIFVTPMLHIRNDPLPNQLHAYFMDGHLNELVPRIKFLAIYGWAAF